MQDHIPDGRGRRRATQHRNDRGVALVEAALVLPLILMLVFGMVTYGIALSQGNAIENATREASRYGATRTVSMTDASPTNAWLDDVANVAVAAATGDMDATVPDRYLCIALVNTKSHDGRRITDGTTTSYDTGSCPDQACPSTAPCVQVTLERSAVLETVAFRRSITVGGASVTAFEREGR